MAVDRATDHRNCGDDSLVQQRISRLIALVVLGTKYLSSTPPASREAVELFVAACRFPSVGWYDIDSRIDYCCPAVSPPCIYRLATLTGMQCERPQKISRKSSAYSDRSSRQTDRRTTWVTSVIAICRGCPKLPNRSQPLVRPVDWDRRGQPGWAEDMNARDRRRPLRSRCNERSPRRIAGPSCWPNRASGEADVQGGGEQVVSPTPRAFMFHTESNDTAFR